MTVIVINDATPAIRGCLKRWFVEPKPNVFVGTVNRRVRKLVLEYVRRNSPGIGLLAISSDNSSQGFAVESFGETDRRPARICGVYLIAEKWSEEEKTDDEPRESSTD